MDKKKRNYLTEAAARELQPGTVIHLGYDDFNVGSMSLEVIGECKEPGSVGKFQLTVRNVTPGEERYKFEIYAFGGPHRWAGEANHEWRNVSIMCKGSGAERLFIKRKPRLKQSCLNRKTLKGSSPKSPARSKKAKKPQ